MRLQFHNDCRHSSLLKKKFLDAYYSRSKIGSIGFTLSLQTTSILTSSLVLSKVDYCSSLFSGCPQSLIYKG